MWFWQLEIGSWDYEEIRSIYLVAAPNSKEGGGKHKLLVNGDYLEPN